MGSSLGVLTLDLVAKIGGFTGPIDKASRHSKKANKDIKKSFGDSLKAITKWGAAVGVGAAAAAVAFTKMSFKAADTIGKVAATAGVATDTLQEMRHAASLSGITFNDLDKGMQAFNKRLGELKAGSGALYTYLTKTDEALMTQLQTTRSTDDALNLMFKAMSKVTDESKRAALAASGFGRSGQRLVILTKDYEKLRKEAQELGLVIDSALIENAEEANDKMDTMSRIISTQLTSAFIELSPALIDVSNTLIEITKNKNITGFFSGLAREISGILKLTTGESAKGVKFASIISEASFKGGEEGIAILDKGMVELRKDIDTTQKTIDKYNIALDKMGEKAKKSNAGDALRENIAMSYKSLDEMRDISIEIMKLQDKMSKPTPDKKGKGVISGDVAGLQLPDDDSWGDFGEVLKATSEANKQKLELIKNSNAAIAAENNRQLKEDIARDVELRQLTEQADLAELNNKYSGVELEIKLHEHKYEKLKELYEEGSEELNQIERIATAERAEINDDYWSNYADSLENNMQNMDSIVGDSLDSLSSQFGNFFASAIMDSENLGDAFKQMATGMVTTALAAIGKMIVQWLVYKAVKIATDKATQAAAIPSYVANAQAGSLLAGINAYASAAAIPYAGWILAPGAMAAALAVTQPMAAGVSAAAMAGLAHDGIDSVPETGTWLLKKGERVVTSQTSKRLDDTLKTVSDSNGSSGKVENVYNITVPVSFPGNFINDNASMRDFSEQIFKQFEKNLSRLGAVV